MENRNIKFFFFGTGKFALGVLEELKANRLLPFFIVTAPDKPQGRGKILQPPPIKKWAEENNIPYCQPPKPTPDILPPNLASCDTFVVAEYGKILPKEIINTPKYGTLNVHPSLLPKYRGPSPIQAALLNGDRETGVTIILIDEQMDHGPVLAQKKIAILDDDDYWTLREKLARLGGELLAQTLPKWIKGEIKAKGQKHSQATYCRIIKKEDGLVDLEKDSPQLIYRKIRALSEWPKSYFFINGKRIIITSAKLEEGKLKIGKIKPEGKREMSLKEYLNGVREAQIRELLSKYL